MSKKPSQNPGEFSSGVSESIASMPKWLKSLCLMVMLAAGFELSGCRSFGMEYRDLFNGCMTCEGLPLEHAWMRISMMRTDERCPQKYKPALDYLAATVANRMAIKKLSEGCQMIPFKKSKVVRWKNCSEKSLNEAGKWYQMVVEYGSKANKAANKVDRSLMAKNIGDIFAEGRGLLPAQRIYLKGILGIAKDWKVTVKVNKESSK